MYSQYGSLLWNLPSKAFRSGNSRSLEPFAMRRCSNGVGNEPACSGVPYCWRQGTSANPQHPCKSRQPSRRSHGGLDAVLLATKSEYHVHNHIAWLKWVHSCEKSLVQDNGTWSRLLLKLIGWLIIHQSMWYIWYFWLRCSIYAITFPDWYKCQWRLHMMNCHHNRFPRWGWKLVVALQVPTAFHYRVRVLRLPTNPDENDEPRSKRTEF